MWKLLVEWFSCHFHTLFGILAQRIIKRTKNEAGLDRLEIKDRTKQMCKLPIWNYDTTHTKIRTAFGSRHWWCSIKKMFLNNLQSSQENLLCRSLILIKAGNFIKKETPTRVFFGDFFEVFKNTFFTEQLSDCFLKSNFDF